MFNRNKKYNIDFYGHRKIYFAVSLTLIGIAILTSIIFGVILDIQFKGGTVLNYTYSNEVDLNKVESLVESKTSATVNVTKGESFVGNKSKTIQVSFASDQGLTADRQAELTKAIQAGFPDNNISLLDSKDVNASSGHDFFAKSIVAVLFALVLLIIYIAFRFKRISGWSAGVMAIIALLHDTLIVYATFVIFRLPIDANFMAVVLTIFGYSINDTIVIYDRIRENKKIYGNKLGVAELVNLSINQSFTRSINTSICVIMTMLVVTIVSIPFQVTSIISFSLPMMTGMISGAYSTICLAGPLWVMWQKHKEKKAAKGNKPTAETVKA